MSIGVFGAGAFGTALAIALARRGAPVTLYARDAAQAETMRKTRRNEARLPGVILPDALTITSDVTTAAAPETLLLSVPMQKLRDLLEANTPAFHGKILVACCKGVELRSGLGPVALIRSLVPGAKPAILTGPSFAADIARGLPTALTLAVADTGEGEALQRALTTPTLRLYRTTDTIGAELGGALKNVVAIACGVVMGARLGESARAALMTRGYAEMVRMAMALGAQPDTLAGLSGFGDLALTCTSTQSRNYRFGKTLGEGRGFDDGVTVEGAPTARAVQTRAEAMGLDMPITDAVVALLDGALSVAQVMDQLLSRPLKEE